MNRLSVSSFLIVLLAPALSFAADPHAHQIWGGWIECDAGYVSKPATGGAICIPAERANDDKFELSSVPSAGDGSRQPRSSSAVAYAPQPKPYTTPSGFTYYPSASSLTGGTLVRPGPGPLERTVIQLPWPY